MSSEVIDLTDDAPTTSSAFAENISKRSYALASPPDSNARPLALVPNHYFDLTALDSSEDEEDTVSNNPIVTAGHNKALSNDCIVLSDEGEVCLSDNIVSHPSGGLSQTHAIVYDDGVELYCSNAEEDEDDANAVHNSDIFIGDNASSFIESVLKSHDNQSSNPSPASKGVDGDESTKPVNKRPVGRPRKTNMTKGPARHLNKGDNSTKACIHKSPKQSTSRKEAVLDSEVSEPEKRPIGRPRKSIAALDTSFKAANVTKEPAGHLKKGDNSSKACIQKSPKPSTSRKEAVLDSKVPESEPEKRPIGRPRKSIAALDTSFKATNATKEPAGHLKKGDNSSKARIQKSPKPSTSRKEAVLDSKAPEPSKRCVGRPRKGSCKEVRQSTKSNHGNKGRRSFPQPRLLRSPLRNMRKSKYKTLPNSTDSKLPSRKRSHLSHIDKSSLMQTRKRRFNNSGTPPAKKQRLSHNITKSKSFKSPRVVENQTESSPSRVKSGSASKGKQIRKMSRELEKTYLTKRGRVNDREKDSNSSKAVKVRSASKSIKVSDGSLKQPRRSFLSNARQTVRIVAHFKGKFIQRTVDIKEKQTSRGKKDNISKKMSDFKKKQAKKLVDKNKKNKLVKSKSVAKKEQKKVLTKIKVTGQPDLTASKQKRKYVRKKLPSMDAGKSRQQKTRISENPQVLTKDGRADLRFKSQKKNVDHAQLLAKSTVDLSYIPKDSLCYTKRGSINLRYKVNRDILKESKKMLKASKKAKHNQKRQKSQSEKSKSKICGVVSMRSPVLFCPTVSQLDPDLTTDSNDDVDDSCKLYPDPQAGLPSLEVDMDDAGAGNEDFYYNADVADSNIPESPRFRKAIKVENMSPQSQPEHRDVESGAEMDNLPVHFVDISGVMSINNETSNKGPMNVRLSNEFGTYVYGNAKQASRVSETFDFDQTPRKLPMIPPNPSTKPVSVFYYVRKTIISCDLSHRCCRRLAVTKVDNSTQCEMNEPPSNTGASLFENKRNSTLTKTNNDSSNTFSEINSDRLPVPECAQEPDVSLLSSNSKESSGDEQVVERCPNKYPVIVQMNPDFPETYIVRRKTPKSFSKTMNLSDNAKLMRKTCRLSSNSNTDDLKVVSSVTSTVSNPNSLSESTVNVICYNPGMNSSGLQTKSAGGNASYDSTLSKTPIIKQEMETKLSESCTSNMSRDVISTNYVAWKQDMIKSIAHEICDPDARRLLISNVKSNSDVVNMVNATCSESTEHGFSLESETQTANRLSMNHQQLPLPEVNMADVLTSHNNSNSVTKLLNTCDTDTNDRINCAQNADSCMDCESMTGNAVSDKESRSSPAVNMNVRTGSNPVMTDSNIAKGGCTKDNDNSAFISDSERAGMAQAVLSKVVT